jgi:hypothetical protein
MFRGQKLEGRVDGRRLMKAKGYIMASHDNNVFRTRREQSTSSEYETTR